MITREQAGQLTYRQTLYCWTQKDSRGEPSRCRVNGAVKTWKTRPNDFQIPVKQGLYSYGYITKDNAKFWALTDEDPNITGYNFAKHLHEVGEGVKGEVKKYDVVDLKYLLDTNRMCGYECEDWLQGFKKYLEELLNA